MHLHAPTNFRVLGEVGSERQRQDSKWGEQNHPDGRQAPKAVVDAARLVTDNRTEAKVVTWRDILNEEVVEAYGAIGDDTHLREELVQVAAVAVAWIEAIDRRQEEAA